MKVKPSKWFYLLGIALLVAGLIISVIFAINSTLTAMRTGERVQLPGQSTLHLQKKGVYAIVYTVANTGKSVGDASPYKNLHYTLTAADGQTVSVTGQGQPVPVFTVKQTGTYTLRAVYPEGKGAQVTAVILPMTNTQSTVLRVLFYLLMAAGVVVVVVTVVLRSREKKRRRLQKQLE